LGKLCKLFKNKALKPKIAVVSTYKTNCGIAEYSNFLYNHLKNFEFKVFPPVEKTDRSNDLLQIEGRFWNKKESLENLACKILSSDCQIVHVQHENGIFDEKSFLSFIKKVRLHKPIVVTFHTLLASFQENVYPTSEEYINDCVNTLNKLNLIIIHTEIHRNILISKNICPEKIKIIPHGQYLARNHDKSELRKKLGIDNDTLVLGAHGFASEFKGYTELIEAIPEIQKKIKNKKILLFCLACSNNSSNDTITTKLEYSDFMKEKVNKMGLNSKIKIIENFLTQDEIQEYLQACDILFALYKKNVGDMPDTNMTCATCQSGAIRSLIAAKRPIIASDSSFIKDLEECSYTLANPLDSKTISCAVKEVLKEKTTKALLKDVEKKIKRTNWDKISQIHSEWYNQVISEFSQPKNDSNSNSEDCYVIDETKKDLLNKKGFSCFGKNKVYADGIVFELDSNTDFGTFEEVFIRKIYNTKLIEKSNNKFIFIDVGANIGCTSLLFANLKNVTDVYSFEPFLPTIKQCRRNIVDLNSNLSSKIKIFDFGWSNKNKTITAPYCKNFSNSASTESQSAHRYSNCLKFYNEPVYNEKVKLKNPIRILNKIFFESILKKRKICLKIDCEGAESEFLPLLDEHRLLKKVSYLFLEWHNINDLEKIENLLHKNNFNFSNKFSENKNTGEILALNGKKK
jgi:FkbM family methyltransferase